MVLPPMGTCPQQSKHNEVAKVETTISVKISNFSYLKTRFLLMKMKRRTNLFFLKFSCKELNFL
jgi:hypothetical protein